VSDKEVTDVRSAGWWDGHHCEGLCPSRSPRYLIQNDVGLVEWVRGKPQRKQCLGCPRQCRQGPPSELPVRDWRCVAGRRHTGSQAAPRARICVVIRVRNRLIRSSLTTNTCAAGGSASTSKSGSVSVSAEGQRHVRPPHLAVHHRPIRHRSPVRRQVRRRRIVRRQSTRLPCCLSEKCSPGRLSLPHVRCSRQW